MLPVLNCHLAMSLHLATYTELTTTMSPEHLDDLLLVHGVLNDEQKPDGTVSGASNEPTPEERYKSLERSRPSTKLEE